jgi:murein L,D-transpeptidase YafK
LETQTGINQNAEPTYPIPPQPARPRVGPAAAILCLLLAFPLNVFAGDKADLVLVNKSERKLYLKSGDKILKTWPVVFGANPVGHKQQEGDERTPEGRYLLDWKKSDSAFYKAIHISYPNEQDKKAAAERGVSPGGAIMIHGQPNGYGGLAFIMQRFDWTDGCIAVTNEAMDEIWEAVPGGTPIEIVP